MKTTLNTVVNYRTERGLDILTVENDHLRVEIVPALGGKISSVYNKKLEREFLWSNAGLLLQENQPGDDYDSHFWGGIDELLPNDLPEQIDGVMYPDHGELWTARLAYTLLENGVAVYGLLPLSGLHYSKTIYLHADAPKINVEYKLVNQTAEHRKFLWKLHAALRIGEGDRLETGARKGRIVSREASRFDEMGEFQWPILQGVDASVVPKKDNTMDFFYLFDSPEGEMGLVTGNGKYRFSYAYDQRIFPYQWYFASYGQFRNHYTAILEPASAMPVSVNEATALGQCGVLEPNGEIRTQVIIYAGENVQQAV